MELKRFECDVFSKDDIKKMYTAEKKLPYKKIFDNVKLVDTAGFVPLDVRIKQFLISGEQYQMSAEMFDSDDWRYMFDHINDTSLEIGDDVEDVRNKLQVVLQRQNEILSRKGLLPEKSLIASDEGSDITSEAKNKADDGNAGKETTPKE